MGKKDEKKDKKGKDKGKDKGKEKGKTKDKHGKKEKGKKGKKHDFKNLTTGKKVAIGAGVAALALGATAGGLYLAKQHKNKSQHGKLLEDHGGQHRAIANLNSCKLVDDPLTSTITIPSPDAITIGLCWDTQQTGQANMDLLASVFNTQGQNSGYIQGNFNLSLFNRAIWHSGDDVKGGAKTNLTTLTGDNENIVIDFSLVPQEIACIMVGVLLVQAQSQLAKADVHISPLLRTEQLEHSESQVQAQATRAVGEAEEESDDDDDDSGDETGATDDDELVLIFKSELEKIAEFPQKRGFVAGRFLRTGAQWTWTPLRQVVQADPNSGVWPSLEYYGKPS